MQYKYAEWLLPMAYEENPMPLLYVRNRKPEEVSKEFLAGGAYENNDEAGFNEVSVHYPE